MNRSQFVLALSLVLVPCSALVAGCDEEKKADPAADASTTITATTPSATAAPAVTTLATPTPSPSPAVSAASPTDAAAGKVDAKPDAGAATKPAPKK